MGWTIYSAVLSTLALIGTAITGTVQVLTYLTNRRDKERERAEREPRVAISLRSHRRHDGMVLRATVINTGRVRIPDGRAFLMVYLAAGEPLPTPRSVQYPLHVREGTNAIEPDASSLFDLDESLVVEVAKLLADGARPALRVQNAERPIAEIGGPELERALRDVVGRG